MTKENTKQVLNKANTNPVYSRTVEAIFAILDTKNNDTVYLLYKGGQYDLSLKNIEKATDVLIAREIAEVVNLSNIDDVVRSYNITSKLALNEIIRMAIHKELEVTSLDELARVVLSKVLYSSYEVFGYGTMINYLEITKEKYN